MKLVKFVRFVKAAIKDPERPFSERVFLILSIISEITVLIALIGDIVTGEVMEEIIALSIILVMVPVTTFVCLYKNRMKFAIRFLVTSLVFVILPILFFFGGGLEGGGVLWTIFAFLFVGLTLSGALRNVMLTLILVITMACYLIEYYHPESVIYHSRGMFFIDSFISLIMVGVVGFVMTWAQNQLYKAENERAKKEAERAEELTLAQNRFFSSMSHEIRTPINSILGLNELILRDTNASEEILRDATGIQGSGKMLLSLINDILDFSKMEAGSMEIVPVDYRVGDVISEIVNMIWIKAHDKGLKFNVSIDPKVPSVLYGDEVRIKQIMINLLNNAVKYTSEGSVDLYIDSELINERTTELSISVSDTGIGIKKETIPYLFTAFKRVDEEKNRHIEGTGLGLSIVKQLTELMGGTVTVNSVYGEGTTFNVTLKQTITDPSQIGELQIHNQRIFKNKQYESSFKAPEAKILIVDDNEMNLEVESKLLLDTGMTIDTAMSGKEALEAAVEKRYDVILMDHLMPEMDGIECLNRLRNQTGGLNRTTPVIVLTANAGSDNRDLYSRSGFDGYLVKPVSGEALEDILMKHIAKDKLIVTGKMLRMREDINTTAGYARKAPVIITSTGMCDLPDSLVKNLNIPILPFLIYTDEGVFKDGIQMDANELIRYISSGKNAVSAPPDIKAYTDFFAAALKKAHHLIHIALTSSMCDDYKLASEAARSFDNVTVINSECLSSATGVLVLIAYKLVQQNIPVEEIIQELETVKRRLRCGFVVNTTEYLAQKGFVSPWINRIARSLSLHPSLKFNEDKSGIGSMWLGSTKRAYKKYINKAFPVDIIPDSDVVFITYVDIPIATLEWIKEEISKKAYFEHVIFQQASAAISSNCGPGTFGILYFVKSNKSYNIGSFIDDDLEEQSDDSILEEARPVNEQPTLPQEKEEEELKWYQQIEHIDGDMALKYSGSEDALRSVLKIFADSVQDKAGELTAYYDSEDWKNYTVKIHALKSSAKLIGAADLSKKAEALEMAGKEDRTDYIREHHEEAIEEYIELGMQLKAYTGTDSSAGEENEKPEADEFLMNSVYEELAAAAENMDSDTITEILNEMDGYSIPGPDGEKYAKIRELAGKYDYDGILKVLSK